MGATSRRDPPNQSVSGNGDDDLRSPRRPEEPTQGIASPPGAAEAGQDRAIAAIVAAARAAALIVFPVTLLCAIFGFNFRNVHPSHFGHH